METLNKLLFELSSTDRTKIMQELQNLEMKLSQISRKLDLTVMEASRHLQRLNEAKLVEKNADGLYGLTPFGDLVLSLLSNLDFVSKNKNYFLEYEASRIPYDFINRIGELGEGFPISETIKNLEEGVNRIKEAKEYVWILSDHILTSSIPPIIEKISAPPFDLRIILPEDMFPPESVSKIPAANPCIHKRVLPKVDVLIVLTEKYATFCLSNKNGKIDYTGFRGEKLKFHKWCKDLYLYYWNKAKRTS